MNADQAVPEGRVLQVRLLGIVPYGEALKLQRRLAEERLRGLIPDTLLLLEHPPVVTLGRGTRAASLPLDPELLRRRGIEVFEIERGGDVTYHGPGQLVGYPILDLQQHRPDLHWYLRQLEATLITALAELGIEAIRNPGYTGVWVGETVGTVGTLGIVGTERTVVAPTDAPRRPTRAVRKIASIGVHVRQWVSWHGFALNVTTDLSAFDLIIPCGIPDVEMTSVARELRPADPLTRPRPDDADLARWHGNLGTRTREAVVGAFVSTFGITAVSGSEFHGLGSSTARKS